MNLERILEKHRLWIDNKKGGSGADLRDAYLRGANLRGVNLRRANLRGADLSGVKGLKTAREFMSQFDEDEHGWIVYKTFGAYKSPPSTWTIEPGTIEEVVNQDPATTCASGINFATLRWIEQDSKCRRLDVWRCRIRYEDAPDITVPYNTSGKARCGRLELIEIVT